MFILISKRCHSNFQSITNYLKNTQPQVTNFDDNLITNDLIRNIFGSFFLADGTLFDHTFFTGLISGIVGYIILGVISRFLNPFLLAASVIVGTIIFIFIGSEFIGNKIKDKITQQITEKLLDDATIKDIRYKDKE